MNSENKIYDVVIGGQGAAAVRLIPSGMLSSYITRRFQFPGQLGEGRHAGGHGLFIGRLMALSKSLKLFCFF